jgi:hypothetical protein
LTALRLSVSVGGFLCQRGARLDNPSWACLCGGAFFSLVVLFAALGIVATAAALYGWHIGTRWKPEDINALIAAESPARVLCAAFWEDFKFLIQYGALFIGAIAFAAAITQIKTIAKIISDFIVARGPIYSLGTTIVGVEKSVGLLSNGVDRLSKLEPTIKMMAEKIEETFAQIANLQRLTVSERTDTAGPESDGPTPAAAPQPEEDRNWERPRELWNSNGERLDEVIERIPDKRRRGKFQRMPRTNYPAIINGLGDEEYISDAARNASLQLHSIFMSYKPRNRRIPDDAVANTEVLDRMLAHELRLPPSEDEMAPSTPPVDMGAPIPA